MTDIVKMLRECSSDEAYLSRQAADEIERLTARVKELEEALSDGVFVLDDLTASRVDDEVLTSLIDEFRAASTQEPT